MDTLDLGYIFRNPALLEEALTHPSVRYEEKRPAPDNQRLEFLGDAILQASMTQALFERFPDWNEGDLTRLRARLVNKHSLEQIARRFDLGSHLRLGKGEIRNQGRTRTSNLADALEAVIGAICLDSGYESARTWVLATFEDIIVREAADDSDTFNAKGSLQELLQGRGIPAPEYELRDESGPDHLKHYEVAVVSQEEELARGTGPSKKAAETAAAAAALIVLQKNPPKAS